MSIMIDAVKIKDIKLQLGALFKRMVFNVVFANIDDYLKNHSFIYNKESEAWQLAPAYDLTYPLNINFNYSNVSRALAINTKRSDIILEDILSFAETYAIKFVKQVQGAIELWESITKGLKTPEKVSNDIRKEFNKLI